jgi:hypothetical protein
MTIPLRDWRELSALLDTALSLPPAERAAWLATLDPEHGRLKPLLQDLLTRPDLAENGSFLEALPTIVADRARETEEHACGSDHLAMLNLALDEARFALADGKAAEARESVAALVPHLRKIVAPALTTLAQALVVAGDALLAQGRAADAVAPLREAEELRQRLLPAESWELAEARARLGEALLRLHDPSAREILRRALTTLVMELGEDHPQTLRARNALTS